MKKIKTKKQLKTKKFKKGFTLVELLAVIVILSLVSGITLVSILPIVKNARQKAFELSAQTAADYLEKQYQLKQLGIGLSELNYIPTREDNGDYSIHHELLRWSTTGYSPTSGKGLCRYEEKYQSDKAISSQIHQIDYEPCIDNEEHSCAKNYDLYMTAQDITKAGLKPENYVAGTWYINKTTGRACVKLYAYTNEIKNQTFIDEKFRNPNGNSTYKTILMSKTIQNLNKTDSVGEFYDTKPIISVGETTKLDKIPGLSTTIDETYKTEKDSESITLCINVSGYSETKKVMGFYSVAQSSGCK